MTVDEVKKRVAEIKEHIDSEDVAHSMEDKLHQDVLLAIACGDCVNPRTIAHEALQTIKLEFARWYS